jgi:cytoskeleton protein RodZ
MTGAPSMNDTAQGEPVADGVTAGTLLRRAREACGLHVAALAVSLKVPVRKLEALEDDRYEQLSDAVFVRALASSVCRTLKIDPQPILERLPQGSKPRLVPDTDGINAPFRAPGDGPQPGLLQQFARPVPLAVAALLLATLAVGLVPGLRWDDSPERIETSAPVPAATPAAAAPSVVVETPSMPVAAASAAVVAPATAPAPLAVPAPSINPAPVLPAAPATAAAAAPPAAAPAAAPAGGVVVFQTKGPSWVQVTDARGNQVLRRMLDANETVGVTGPLPLSVTVGNVQTTQVQVRGKPMDLAPIARDNVARFEVK